VEDNYDEFVYHQLAIDYNCSSDDFLKDGFIFTEAREYKFVKDYFDNINLLAYDKLIQLCDELAYLRDIV
jgi:hypothetical protein